MVSGSEMKALKTVLKENGETTTRLISRQLGIDPSYATVLCAKLIKSDHLARETRGRFRITPKGKKPWGGPMRIRPLKPDGRSPTGKSIEKNSSGALSNRSKKTPTIPNAAFLNPARKK